MKLITLEEWDESRKDLYQPAPNVENGILCPDCHEAELVDPNPYNLLTSIPPRYETECLKCGYKGTRIA